MKKVIFIFSLALISTSIKAQGIIGLSFQGFAPTGELRQDSPDIWGAGLSLEAGYKLPNAPIIVGANFDMLRYGSELRKGWHGEFWGDVRWRRNFEAVRFLPFVRVQPNQSGKILPYGDFYTGLSYIVTRTTIRERGLDLIDSYVELDNAVLSYGFGGGVEVMIADDVSLDLNMRYIRSGRARYLTPSDVTYDTEAEDYNLDVQNSRFNALTFGVGVKVVLSDW